MTLALPQAITSPLQAWKLIEQDYTLRLSLVASEWATEHLKAWNAVFAEARKRGNSAYSGSALIKMEIADADRRAEWAVQTCYEIWRIQGRDKCKPFFRAIFECCLQPMFSVREGCFRGQLELHGKRTREIPQGNSAVLGDMKRQMNSLRAKWNTRLEIATRDHDYQQHSIPAQQTQEPLTSGNGSPFSTGHQSAIDSTLTWKELESLFRVIQNEPTEKRRVGADFIRTAWDTGNVTEEWILSGDPVPRKRFEHLVLIAARKLGCTTSADADKFWLDRVREWMQGERLDRDRNVAWLPTGTVREHGSTGTTEGLWTERIAELSAMFCMELIARGVPESADSSRPEQARSIPSRSKKLSAYEQRRRRVIFGALQLNLIGLKYCEELDAKKLAIPRPWMYEGCPKTYVEAYQKGGRWKKGIQDEKYRYKKKYDDTKPHERERIIDGSTRATRQ